MIKFFRSLASRQICHVRHEHGARAHRHPASGGLPTLSVQWGLLATPNISEKCSKYPNFRAVVIDRSDDDRQSHVAPSRTTRRCFLSGLVGAGSTALAPTLAVISPMVANSAVEPYDSGNDLVSRMFNPDGSVREGVDVAPKFRIVSFDCDPTSDALQLAVDGGKLSMPASTTSTQIVYQLPEKWSANYVDRGENATACERITVYQAPGQAAVDRLQTASNVGVPQALLNVSSNDKFVNDLYQQWSKADLVSGRTRHSTRDSDDNMYYDFDLARAPLTCGTGAAENLGLGFCPYDQIMLVSATVVHDRLYVLLLECNKDEWQRSSSDLRRVRSSFAVESSAIV